MELFTATSQFANHQPTTVPVWAQNSSLQTRLHMTFTSENYWGVNLLTYLLLRKKNSSTTFSVIPPTPRQTNKRRRHQIWPCGGARVFAARGKGPWCRPSEWQHPSSLKKLKINIKLMRLFAVHCNANAKIIWIFVPQMPLHGKRRPGQPPSLPLSAAIECDPIFGGGS